MIDHGFLLAKTAGKNGSAILESGHLKMWVGVLERRDFLLKLGCLPDLEEEAREKGEEVSADLLCDGELWAVGEAQRAVHDVLWLGGFR